MKQHELDSDLERREAVFRTLKFEQGPACPYYIWIHEDMVPPLAEYFGKDNFVGKAGSVHTFAGSYTAMTEITALPVDDHGEYYIDEYGVTFRRGSTLHVERSALPQPSLTDYEFPDLTTDDHYAHLEEWIDTHTGRFRIVQLGMLFFERTWGMRGMEEFFTDMYLHQGFVEELLDGLEEVCHEVIDHLLSNYGNRIDAIGLSDDYGSQSSMLISPESWRKYIKPRIRRLIAHIHRGGKITYLHSCGHIEPVIPDLVEIGVDMLQPVQPETMDVFKLKNRFGSQICLVGGISTQELLPYGTPDKIRDQVWRCREEIGLGGGYILAPAKPVLPGVPIENAIALIEAMQQNTFS